MDMVATVSHKTVVRAVECFFQRPDIHGNLELLRRRLPPSADIFVAGGAIRNLIIDLSHGGAPPTRDIDIFIGGLDRNFSLADLLRDQPTHPTDLKGLRWQPDSSALAYDLCLLPDFVVIDIGHLEPTVENLLTGIDFTVNAIIYDLNRNTLVERGCLAAIGNRTIAFNSRLIPGRKLIAYRILLIRHKTGFNLAEPVFDFINSRLDLETVTHLKRLFRAKLGQSLAAAIMEDVDALWQYRSYAAYMADQSA
jgi:hypothetical protein